MIDWRSAVALFWALGGWFVAAVFLGASGQVRKSPLILLAGMVVPFLVFWILSWWITSISMAKNALPTEVFVLTCAARVLGGLYLFESGTGLASEWATPAGVLALALGLPAIPLGLLAFPADDIPKKTLVILWNVVGMIEAVVMPIYAIVLAFVTPGSMLTIMQMPAFLMPAFVMPLLLWCHAEISSRLWRGF